VGFLVPLSAKVAHASQLGGNKICLLAETQVEVALRAWFAHEHMKFVPFPFQEEGEMEAAFVTANCTALAGDATRLANTRVGFGPLAARYVLLPEEISKDPLAAAFRTDDAAFAEIVRWTMEVLVQAEESGLTRSNVTGAIGSSDPAVQILTGHTREIGSRLGLDDSWATRAIAAVGNYGEVFERDLGDKSRLELPRGLNRLYTEGGLMYALPVK
jgi:general L-amino acid transport system substrate-binding protein